MAMFEMASAKAILISLLVATATGSSLAGNLNYHSPSARHASLGIDTSLVARRAWKRGNVAYAPSELHFTHGVASGDPHPDSVILWTRVAPANESDASDAAVRGTARLYSHETDKFVKADPNPICVEWTVAKSKCGANATDNVVVARGTAYTTSDIDYTVKVEAKGLQPLTKYYYQFKVCGSEKKSTWGRTKTAPREDDDVSSLSFAVFSCSNFREHPPPARFGSTCPVINVWDKHDWVIHLGDYIYERNDGTGERAAKPAAELFTLHDYRTRHGQYRSDEDLQLLSKNSAWIPTWDDHEFADNGWRDGFTNMNNTEDSFNKNGLQISVDTRKVNAVRAYFEWMPLRQVDLDDGLRIWRSFKMGKLLDLIILDTRNYDRSVTSVKWNQNYIDKVKDDPSRTLMGARQESWFYRSLSESKDRGAKWRIVGNQVIFSRINDNGISANLDIYNGYVANRNRTLEHMYENNIGNNIFLAGDSHQNWVSDLAWRGVKDYDGTTGAGAIGVEFAGTAVSSKGQRGPIEPTAGDSARGNIARNPELMWQEGYYRGYFTLRVTPDKAEAKFFGSPSVATRNAWDLSLANFTVVADENHLERPIGGGKAESGALRFGEIEHTNVTLNTETKKWEVVGFENMHIGK
ncbi:hypothetical protein PWT90_02294 [Aphanocladium album]|nr:hypothetical protein PWT90_02294 [Aphanocladium album]